MIAIIFVISLFNSTAKYTEMSISTTVLSQNLENKNLETKNLETKNLETKEGCPENHTMVY